MFIPSIALFVFMLILVAKDISSIFTSIKVASYLVIAITSSIWGSFNYIRVVTLEKGALYYFIFSI